MQLRQKIPILLIFFLVTAPFFQVSSAQNDAGSGIDAPDERLSAISLALDTSYTGELGDNLTNVDLGTDNHDYFKFSISEAGNFSLDFEVTNQAVTSLTMVSILDNNGLTIGIESLFQDDTPFYLVVPIITAQTIYVELNSYSDLVSYSIRGTFVADSYAQNDAGSPGDTDLLSPKSINLDTTYTGRFGNGEVESDGLLDESDWYSVDLGVEGYLDCSATLFSPDTDYIFIYTKTSSFDTITSNSEIFTTTVTTTAPIYGADTFLVGVATLGWNASYELSCSFTPATLPTQNDADTGGDASENILSAPEVPVNSTLSGTVGEGLLEEADHARDDVDLYKIEPINYGQTSLSLTLLESPDSYPSVYVRLYNASDLFGSSYITLGASSFTPYEEGSVILSEGSSYYLEVDTLDANVSYSIEINHTEMVLPQFLDSTPPDISSPSDLSYEEGAMGNTIVWTVSDAYPDVYNITLDGAIFTSTTSWSSGSISVDIDGLAVGSHTFVLTIYDIAGNSASDMVTVTVDEPMTSTTSTTTTTSTTSTTTSTTTSSTSSTTSSTSTTATSTTSSTTTSSSTSSSSTTGKTDSTTSSSSTPIDQSSSATSTHVGWWMVVVGLVVLPFLRTRRKFIQK